MHQNTILQVSCSMGIGSNRVSQWGMMSSVIQIPHNYMVLHSLYKTQNHIILFSPLFNPCGCLVITIIIS